MHTETTRQILNNVRQSVGMHAESVVACTPVSITVYALALTSPIDLPIFVILEFTYFSDSAYSSVISSILTALSHAALISGSWHSLHNLLIFRALFVDSLDVVDRRVSLVLLFLYLEPI